LSKEDDLKARIDALHVALNELYALDDSWRTLGEWPEPVRGSVLHNGASAEQIAQAEARLGCAFPPSYKEFLHLHSAWEHFWGDFTLVGIGAPATQRAQDKIAEYVQHQTSKLRDKFGDGFSPAAVAAWEAEEERNLYLANQLIVGTNFGGDLWVFDTRTREPNGELKLVSWDISYGAQEPMFETFHAFIESAAEEVAFRLKHLKRKKGRPGKKTS
jgi:hypothetical protein